MRVQRRTADDVLVRDGETAILVGGMAVRLSELGAMIYALTDTPVEVADLSSELESRYGAPPESSSREATELAVADLVRQGVLSSDQ